MEGSWVDYAARLDICRGAQMMNLYHGYLYTRISYVSADILRQKNISWSDDGIGCEAFGRPLSSSPCLQRFVTSGMVSLCG